MPGGVAGAQSTMTAPYADLPNSLLNLPFLLTREGVVGE